jgi:hypothetical protein
MKVTRTPISHEVAIHSMGEHTSQCDGVPDPGGRWMLLVCECGASSIIVICTGCREAIACLTSTKVPCECVLRYEP